MNKKMNFDEYQRKSRKTAIYPNAGRDIIYPTLGLSGEAGEVSEKVKKLIRDKEGIIDDDFKNDIAKELGDVLWYIAQLSTELELQMSDIAKKNIEKLYSRMDRDVLGGSGDDR